MLQEEVTEHALARVSPQRFRTNMKDSNVHGASVSMDAARVRLHSSSNEQIGVGEREAVISSLFSW